MLLQTPIAEYQHAIEIASKAGAMKHPNNAAPNELFLQSLGNACLGVAVERRRRFIQNQQIRTFQDGARDSDQLALSQRQSRAAGPDVIIEPDLDNRLAQTQRPR